MKGYGLKTKKQKRKEEEIDLGFSGGCRGCWF